MKKIIKINEEIRLEIIERWRRTRVLLYDNKQKITLSDIKKRDFFWCKVVYDENYIVVYTRGCMINQIPLNVEAAFSIKNKKLINLENKRFKTLLVYMLIRKKSFDLNLVLQTINNENLHVIEEVEKDDLIRYLTCESDKVSREQVINYILKSYPILTNYTKLIGTISVVEYKRIVQEIGYDTLSFHIMSIPLEDVKNPYIDCEILEYSNYRQIYISEYERNIN